MLKALALASLVFVAVGAASVTWYYAKYLPSVHDAELAEEHRKISLENARQCSEDGERFFSHFVSLENTPSGGKDFDEPEMHFSNQLNTCLVHIRWYEALPKSGTSYQYNEVIDIYKNRPILYGHFIRAEDGKETLLRTMNPEIPNYTSAKYYAEKDQLFNQ